MTHTYDSNAAIKLHSNRRPHGLVVICFCFLVAHPPILNFSGVEKRIFSGVEYVLFISL